MRPGDEEGEEMHTHFSFMSAAQVFLSVLVIGTLWRLTSLHLVASSNENLAHLGKAMSVQY
jgi:hypothetical protein